MTAVALEFGGEGAAGCGQPVPLPPGIMSLTEAPSATPEGAHPNVFVRGLPLAWGESELAGVFAQYGE